MATRIYRLNVKRPMEFLQHVLDILKGQAYISFEGDLTRGSSVAFENALKVPFGEFRMNASGRHDYLIVPLNETNRLKVRNVYVNMVGVRANVWHIEVVENDKLVLGAYDCFHPECVWVREETGKRLGIAQLISEGVLGEAVIAEVEI